VISVPLVKRSATALGEGVIRVFSLENALAGTLPVRPNVAYLVSSTGSKRILEQNGAYYIHRIPPGRYAMRMEFYGGFQARYH